LPRPKAEAFVADRYGNRRAIVFDAGTGAYKRHWDVYSNLQAFATRLPFYVCGTASTLTMPNSFLTFNRFWLTHNSNTAGIPDQTRLLQQLVQANGGTFPDPNTPCPAFAEVIVHPTP
jgi:hypothetical protein